MFDSLDGEELAIIQMAMNNLMLFRLLLDRGFDIEKGLVRVVGITPGYADLSYGYDDNCQLEYDNGDWVSELIFKDNVEYKNVRSTDFDLLLSTDLDDDSEGDIMQWLVRDPRIMNFYEYCKQNNITEQDVIFTRYSDLACSLIDYGDPWSDCQYYESYASKDLSEGLVILCTGCEFVNYTFVKSLFALYDYCEEVVKGGYPK